MGEDGAAGACRERDDTVTGIPGFKVTPLRPGPLLFLGWVLLALLFTGCGRVPRIIVLTDPLSAEEHLDLGVAYERKGELDLAAREYERALRQDRNLVQARINLGNVRMARKEYREAKEEYRKALSLHPGHIEASNNLAWAAILSGTGLEDAAARVEAVLAAEKHRTSPLLDTLGVLRMKLHRPGAEEAFAEAERRCLAAPMECPDTVLREIREHREELSGRSPSPPPLVQ